MPSWLHWLLRECLAQVGRLPDHLSAALAMAWRWVRTAPHLEAWALIAMASLVMLCQALGYHDHQVAWMPSSGNDVPDGWVPPGQGTLFYHYLTPYLKLIGLLGGLVFHLALLRAESDMRRLIVPTWIGCGFLALWAVLGELHEHGGSGQSMAVGQPFSRPAYAGQMLLLALLILSPAISLSYYQTRPIWERYVLRQFAQPLAFCLIAFCSLWIASDLIDNLREFQEAKVRMVQVLSFYANLVPFMLVQSACPSLLLATLYALLRMVRHNEMVSLSGMGLSLTRMLRPLLLTTVLVASVSMAANYYWAPHAEGEREAVLRGIQSHAEGALMASSVMHYDTRTRRQWFVAGVPYNVRDEKLKRVQIRQFNERGELEHTWFGSSAMRAPNGMWSVFRGIEIVYKDGERVKEVLFNDPTSAIQRCDIKGWPETPWDLISSALNPDVMGVPDLAGFMGVESIRTQPLLIQRYRSELWHRFSYPWQSLALMLAVASLVPSHSRQGLLRAVTFGIGMFFVLMFLNSTTLNLARTGRFPPGLILWLPHLLIATFGVVQLAKRSGCFARAEPARRTVSRWLRGRRTRRMSVACQTFFRSNQGM